MLRTILFIVIGFFLVTFVRMVAGVLFKGIGEMMQPSEPERTAPVGGELKRDPVCGTFVATSSSIKKTVRGETVYFCSTECRDKFAG